MENKMFIEIAEHAGAEKWNSSTWQKEFTTCKIGLNQIAEVEFDSDNKDIITFKLTDSWISLKFSDEGMGEYKRILDDKTIR